jgi:uncharacterized FlaG/YvyC family protein
MSGVFEEGTMADNLLPTVGAIVPIGESAEAARMVRLPGEAPQAKFEAVLGQAEARPEVEPENKPESKAKDKASEAGKMSSNPDAFNNVRLHFRVDPKTHEVTVLMVDKATHRVVRSIPPEELGKLKEGDLVELFA